MRAVLRGLPAVVARLTLDVLDGYRFGLIGWIVWACAVWIVIGVVVAVILAVVT